MSDSNKRQSVTDALASHKRQQKQSRQSEAQSREAGDRLKGDLNALLLLVMHEHNRKERVRAPQPLPVNGFIGPRPDGDKGLRQLEHLRVEAITLNARRIEVRVEAILTHSLVAMEEEQVFQAVRADLCPPIKAALEGFDPRIAAHPHLAIFYLGPLGELGNYESAMDY